MGKTLVTVAGAAAVVVAVAFGTRVMDAPASHAGSTSDRLGTVNADPDGKAIFHGKGMCFACHGPEGAGTPVGPALNDGEWIHFEARPDADRLRALVRAGVEGGVPGPHAPHGRRHPERRGAGRGGRVRVVPQRVVPGPQRSTKRRSRRRSSRCSIPRRDQTL